MVKVRGLVVGAIWSSKVTLSEVCCVQVCVSSISRVRSPQLMGPARETDVARFGKRRTAQRSGYLRVDRDLHVLGSTYMGASVASYQTTAALLDPRATGMSGSVD